MLGADPFGSELQKMVKDRQISGRPIVVRHFATAAAKGTHLSVVSSAQVRR